MIDQDMVCEEPFSADTRGVADLLASTSSEMRFGAYIEGLVDVIGHADRAMLLHDYCLGC
jgi:hypothetical protein